MSEWQTVSVRRMDNSTDSYTRFISNEVEENPRLESTMIASRGCEWGNTTFYLSHDVADAYVVTLNDTSHTGTIGHVFGEDIWFVEQHENSLYTTNNSGDTVYQYSTDVLADLPDWVQVGGNWPEMKENNSE